MDQVKRRRELEHGQFLRFCCVFVLLLGSLGLSGKRGLVAGAGATLDSGATAALSLLHLPVGGIEMLLKERLIKFILRKIGSLGNGAGPCHRP